MAAAKPATVRVLHRAVGSDEEDSSPHAAPGSPQLTMQELQAANQSLKQRLEQAKASAAAEKKKLADELRLERAGRERAEELLVRQAKELEACAAAKARLEEAFSRSMSELRYTRAEHSQSKQTIQQLLRELMLLRDAMSRSQGSNTAGGRSGTCGNNPPGIAVNGSSSSSRGGAGTDGGAGSPTASSLTSSKQMSKGKLVSELQQLQARYAEEAARRKEAEAEKERAEECQEMISRQTAKLLDDRAALMSDLSSKDDVVRDLQSGLDHLQHQLHIALNDRNLLLQQLRTLAGEAAAPELDALTAAMATGFSQDLDELEAFAHGEYNGELHGALGEVCSPRSRAQTAGGGGQHEVTHLLADDSARAHRMQELDESCLEMMRAAAAAEAAAAAAVASRTGVPPPVDVGHASAGGLLEGSDYFAEALADASKAEASFAH